MVEWYISLILALTQRQRQRQRQKNFYEFMASLVYKVPSQPRLHSETPPILKQKQSNCDSFTQRWKRRKPFYMATRFFCFLFYYKVCQRGNECVEARGRLQELVQSPTTWIPKTGLRQSGLVHLYPRSLLASPRY